MAGGPGKRLGVSALSEIRKPVGTERGRRLNARGEGWSKNGGRTSKLRSVSMMGWAGVSVNRGWGGCERARLHNLTGGGRSGLQ